MLPLLHLPMWLAFPPPQQTLRLSISVSHTYIINKSGTDSSLTSPKLLWRTKHAALLLLRRAAGLEPPDPTASLPPPRRIRKPRGEYRLLQVYPKQGTLRKRAPGSTNLRGCWLFHSYLKNKQVLELLRLGTELLMSLLT